MLSVQAPRTQRGLLHVPRTVSTCPFLSLWPGKVCSTPSLWTTRLPSLPEWFSSPLFHCLLLSSDPFGDLSFPVHLTPVPDSQLPALGSVTSVTGSSVCPGTWLIVCILCVPFSYRRIRRASGVVRRDVGLHSARVFSSRARASPGSP